MTDWNEDVMDILYGENLEFEVSYYESLEPATLMLQNSLWEDLKIENSVEPWIYITSLSILLFVAGILLYNYIVKRIRDNY